MEGSVSGRADYGIDAPTVVQGLALGGVGCLAGGIVLYLLLGGVLPALAQGLLVMGVIIGLSYLITSGLMVWSSKSGKLRERERLVDLLKLQGDETVLDVGCGRGLVLNAVARRLDKGGKAVGIDLWQSVDQSGNTPDATWANAKAEGVADRVSVETGDMRQMPFPDEMFDAVVSSMAIHNVPDAEGRAQAIREIARVLKPGGGIALLDFQKTEEYVKTLQSIGWKDAKRSGSHYGMFPPVRVVIGIKPD